MEMPARSVGAEFTFEDMMRVAVCMSRIKDGEALEDVVPALQGGNYQNPLDSEQGPVNLQLKIHGR